MLTALRLPFSFDLVRLRADLARVSGSDWSPHYNRLDFGGAWRGAALRSASGAPTELAAVAPAFLDTPLLARCSYFRETLAAFECPLKAVRILSLEPGSFIREHSDNALDFEDGEVRIHIPIQTNSAVEFYLDGERLRFEEGGAYYVNVNLPHRVNNRGDAPRVHLVIDAAVNGWLRALFARSGAVPICPPPERGVEAFRDALLSEPALASTLRNIADPGGFTAAAVRVGCDRSFDLHENDVDALVRGRPRRGPAGGLPIALRVRGDEAEIEWIDADPPLAEPFFEDTVRACLRNPYTRFSRRLAPIPPACGALAPAGLIFHMSRCGSTLAGRMLAAAGRRVISEAAAMDAAVQTGRADWVRETAGSLGAGAPYILKLDAWHVHALPLLRAAFPDTPWIFLFRDPIEVLASHARSPGVHVLPGALDPRALGMEPPDMTRVPRSEWPVRVLARICEAALRHADDPRALFVDYRDLPGAMWGAVSGHFRIDASPAAMREAARFHAKNPAAEFQPDSQAKQIEGAAFRAVAESAGLSRLYAELRARAEPRDIGKCRLSRA